MQGLVWLHLSRLGEQLHHSVVGVHTQWQSRHVQFSSSSVSLV